MQGLEAEWLPIQASIISTNARGGTMNILPEKNFGYMQLEGVGMLIKGDGLLN